VSIADHLPYQKLIGFPGKYLISFAYQHQADAIKNLRWSMKVPKAINLFVEIEVVGKFLRRIEMKYELKAKIVFGLSLILYLVYFPLFVHGQSTPVGIPNAIKIILDRNYPGWEIGAVSIEVDKFFKENKFKFSPVLVSGDFDGDSKVDYAIKINYKGMWHAIVFLARGVGYKKYVLMTGGNAPDLDVYLFLHKKGEKGFNFEAGKYFIFQNDAVEIGFYEKGSIAYIYQENRFDKVFTSD
jgi:hypothetical protein